MSWLLDDAILIGIPLISVVIAALVIPAYLALRGPWRTWTVKKVATPGYASAKRPYFPFTLLCCALIFFVLIPTLFFEALSWEQARKFMWTVPLWIPAAALLTSFVWWPAFLAPKWYRRWRAAGGTSTVMPWSSKEIAAAQALPEGRRKDKILRNIEASKALVQSALLGLDQRN